ncbi:MAG: histidine kinase [Bacteroidales bacterium]
MKAIRNQIEPHFTLNVLNAIGGLYLTEENRQQADYIFGRYASLIRQTVITSDKVIISLEDELEFVSNYIDIERFRAGNSFEYLVETDPAIDMAMRIPRMLIYTLAENSVKHGLRRRAEGGVLRISAGLNGGHVSVIVEDNGPGLASDGSSPTGTGKG